MAVSGLPRSPSSTTLALDAGSHCRTGTSFRPLFNAKVSGCAFSPGKYQPMVAGYKWFPEQSCALALDDRVSLPQRLKLRRDDPFVSRRRGQQPARPCEGVERLDRFPGNRRIVVRRVASNELGDEGKLRRREMSSGGGGGERGIIFQRALRAHHGADRRSHRVGSFIDRFLRGHE